MLNCRDVTSMATDHMEGALPPMRRLQVWLHLAICWMCRRYVEQLTLTSRALHRLTERKSPAETPASLREAFRQWKSDRRQ